MDKAEKRPPQSTSSSSTTSESTTNNSWMALSKSYSKAWLRKFKSKLTNPKTETRLYLTRRPRKCFRQVQKPWYSFGRRRIRFFIKSLISCKDCWILLKQNSAKGIIVRCLLIGKFAQLSFWKISLLMRSCNAVQSARKNTMIKTDWNTHISSIKIKIIHKYQLCSWRFIKPCGILYPFLLIKKRYSI